MLNTITNWLRPPPKNDSIRMSTGPCTFSQCAAICPGGKFDVESGEFLPNSTFCTLCGHGFNFHKNLPAARSRPDVTLPADFDYSLDSKPLKEILPPQHIDSAIYPRPEMIRKLWSQLTKVGLISVRATPTAGKSKTGELLRSFVERNLPSIAIVSFSWPGANEKGELSIPTHYNYLTIFEESGRVKDIDNLLKQKTVLVIIDEAQNSYQYHSFWNEFIKGKAEGSGSPYTILLSSYGSPGDTVTEFKGSAPYTFGISQRVSARCLPENNAKVSLYLSRSELTEVLTQLNYVKNHHIQLTEEAINFIYFLTSGHVGAIRLMYDYLQEQLRPYLRSQEKVDSDAVHTALYNNVNKFCQTITSGGSAFSRSVVKKEILRKNPNMAAALRKVLAKGGVQDSTEDPGIFDAYQLGYLQAEVDFNGETTYIFPSIIHQFYVERLLSQSDFPLDKFDSVDTLLFTALKQFSPMALQTAGNRLSSGSQPLPVEAAYQSELYRTLYLTLGNKCFVTSEYSASSSGRIDFILKAPGWGIEALREGTEKTIKEHVNRFGPAGSYGSWMNKKHLKDACVVDFRTSPPDFSLLKNPPCRLYYAVYYDNFQYCALFTHDGKEVLSKFVLLEA